VRNSSRGDISLGPVLALLAACGPLTALLSGCAGGGAYTNESLYPADIESICIDMFENRSFRRGVEYTVSDALVKRIASETPYRIVSDKNRADSVMSGQLVSIGDSVLTLEREIGRPLEKEAVLAAVVNWKDLKTGRLMINNVTVTVAAGYSEFQGQDFTYAATVAANKLARRIVELMQNNW
jgi:hypothetical protein